MPRKKVPEKKFPEKKVARKKVARKPVARKKVPRKPPRHGGSIPLLNENQRRQLESMGYVERNGKKPVGRKRK
tara:strand:+ start:1863 stop:2081 length:219 start_codon:yes stop_codon:yes gene_type:complete